MLDSKNIELFESTLIYIKRTFDVIDFSKLSVTIEQNSFFDILYSYSIDGINYSVELPKESYTTPINYNVPIYLCIYCKRHIQQNIAIPNTIYAHKNVNDELNHIIISEIKYDSIIFDFNKDFHFKTYYQLVNEYPRWNFYDNQQITIRRWLDTCNAMAEMYGHTCIYFKTEPDANSVSHTFANNVIRNVVDIKKLQICSPGNELPQDRNVYTDWDMPLQDEFMLQIIWEKFKLAFGENTIPNEKDYLYLPIINKLFRISTVQPKNGFMGVIGWWEVFLSKFEDDETVKIDKALKDTFSGIPSFVDALDKINFEETYEDDDEFLNPIGEVDEFLEDTLLTAEKIAQDTIEEKKASNQNITNKIMDTTFKVSLKETEKLREFFDNRLKIISVNPGEESFPITMYDNSTIEKRTIAIQYNLIDYTTKNKFSTIFSDSLLCSFNYVLLESFVGEIFDINSDSTPIITIENRYRKLNIIDNLRQITIPIEFTFEKKEFYNVEIIYTKNQYAIKIFTILNKEKTLVFQNIYIVEIIENQITNFNKLLLFGGKFYVNEITLAINSKRILTDYCNPVMNLNRFG